MANKKLIVHLTREQDFFLTRPKKIFQNFADLIKIKKQIDKFFY